MGIDPVSLLIISTAISGAVSFVGSQQAASAQEDQANYQAAVDQRNEEISRQDRIVDIQTAEIAEEDMRRNNRRQLAVLRSSYGTSGVELTGSPLEVLQDSAIEMALDERRVGFEGEVRAREGAVSILGLQDSASASTAAAKNARTAGRISGASSLLSTGTSIAGIKAKQSRGEI